MTHSNFIATQIPVDQNTGLEELSSSDKKLVSSFPVNTIFDPSKSYIELHTYSIDGTLLESNHYYTNQSFLGDSGTSGGKQAKGLTLDPVADAKIGGYEFGGIKFVYNFLDDLYSETTNKIDFFIEEISPDRTEIRLLTTKLDNDKITSYTNELKNRIDNSSYTFDLRANFNFNRLFAITNINLQEYKKENSVIVKLYEPLSEEISIKDTLVLNEIISDSVAFEIDVEVIDDVITVPYIKGPNFNLEATTQVNAPSEYFNYTDLFSFPTSNSYRELNSLFQEKSIDISIDYSDYEDFIHFSSANERLRNFKYKLELIESYQINIDAIESASNTSSGISGSREYYQGLINTTTSNFDHYDRHLYYESGSTAWPKTNSTTPYINAIGSAATSWYNQENENTALFDLNNPSILINSIPSYLREDPDNNPYNIFIYMLAQHFDNLWIYSKAMTDKYDADNRINKGISKDLVQEALKNFGVKLYTSNRSTGDLFKMFTGETYQTGSEVINSLVSASNETVSEEDYRKEIYKRLYHNLPLLLKAKGTERGLKALISSFGIPTNNTVSGSEDSISGLYIRTLGGLNNELNEFKIGGEKNRGHYFIDPTSDYTSSAGKIRLDNTGSTVSGSTLSQYTSIVRRATKYTDDSHVIEIGYSPTNDINEILKVSSSYDAVILDNLIGDPGEIYSGSYEGLVSSSINYLQNVNTRDLQDYTRIIKYYDNVIFKTTKDFIPARSNISSGIIIKPHALERSKAKQVSLTGKQEIKNNVSQAYRNQFIGDITITGSVDVGSNEGGNAAAFGGRDQLLTLYSSSVMTPDGPALYNYHTHEEVKFDGEFSGSHITVSQTDMPPVNPWKYENPNSITYNINNITTLLVLDCTLSGFTAAYVVCPAPIITSITNNGGGSYTGVFSLNGTTSANLNGMTIEASNDGQSTWTASTQSSTTSPFTGTIGDGSTEVCFRIKVSCILPATISEYSNIVCSAPPDCTFENGTATYTITGCTFEDAIATYQLPA